MFDGHNEALRRSTGSGRFSLWAINNRFQALETARQGWLAAAWLAVGYSFSLIVSLAANYRPNMKILMAAISAFGIALAVTLAAFIFRKQPRWAAVVLLVWAVLELLLKILAVFGGGAIFAPSIITNCVLLYLAIRTVRGAFMLASFNRRVDVATVGATFE